jgi:hypothetical protein
LDFRRFRKAEQCAERGVPFRDHTALTLELIDWVCQQGIPGAFAFDSYFTNAPILNHIHGRSLPNGLPRAYVGSLKFNRKLHYRGRLLKASDLAAEIAPSLRKALTAGERQQWYFTCTLQIPGVRHKVRVLILWQRREDEQARIIVVTNRVQWEASRIVRVYRHRWTGTETFHPERETDVPRTLHLEALQKPSLKLLGNGNESLTHVMNQGRRDSGLGMVELVVHRTEADAHLGGIGLIGRVVGGMDATDDEGGNIDEGGEQEL